MKTIFCFGGQGSQYYKMGEELFHNNELFRSWMEKLDRAAFKQLGVSLIEIIYNNSKKDSALFNRTLFTHPAIFMIEYSLTMVLIERNIKPDFTLGTSLGEFAAMTIASSLQPETVLSIVIDQAKILEKKCSPGGMIAILASEQVYKENNFLYDNVELAAINYHNHFVVSGCIDGIRNAIEGLKMIKIPYFNLPVSSGFHSSLIDPAKDELIEKIKSFQCKPFQIPIISCCYQQILNESIDNFFWDIIRKPISFKSTINKIIDKNEHYTFIDVSPSGTLANFLKYSFKPENKNRLYFVLNQYRNDLKNLDMITNDRNLVDY